MDSTPEFSIDDLVERRTVEDYGTFRCVSSQSQALRSSQTPCELKFSREYSRSPETPRVAMENPANAMVSVTLQRQKEHIVPALEPDPALLSALERMTPPVDQEAEDNEARAIEATSRRVLINEGCPPCYPPHLDVPLRDPLPEKYQAITSYWQSFPGTGDVVLRAQLSDWERFREFQTRVRRYYEHRNYRNFGEFVDRVRERRRRRGLGGNVCLRLDLDQSPLETWIEFQDWQLQRLQEFENERDELYKAWKVAEESGSPDSGAHKQNLEYAEWKLQRHNTLLHWIEQKRLGMDAGHQTPAVEEDGDHRESAPKAVPAVSSLTRGKKKDPTVLGDVRVSKATHRLRNTPRQKRKFSESKPAIGNMDTPKSEVLQASKRRENKPRRSKTETPLRKLRLQRVSKSKLSTDANAKLLQRARQKRSPLQRPQPTSVEVKTRSGRVSRRPER
ncbi:MAG: hypothetical protein M1836_001109 [Candelina mexicana]|nr:MAG: hypothetical protein M1836_001109 [Candelina mexicana]